MLIALFSKCVRSFLLYPQWLILERNTRFEQIDIAYSGGLRYPHLEATGKGETAIDRLLSPQRTN